VYVEAAAESAPLAHARRRLLLHLTLHELPEQVSRTSHARRAEAWRLVSTIVARVHLVARTHFWCYIELL
jgi:hypothetical protein